MKSTLTALLIISWASTCWAGTTICTIKNEAYGISTTKTLAWNDETKVAKMTDVDDISDKGTVTLKKNMMQVTKLISCFYIIQHVTAQMR